MNFFSPSETSCKCGCGKDIDPRLLSELNMLRHSFGAPLMVASGARCHSHNKSVGGATSSLHLLGLAADLHWSPDALQRWNLMRLAVQRFNGIGVYQTFLHVDLRYLARKNSALWIGKY